MSVVISPSYVLPNAASADIADGRNPVIGYKNIATASHLSTTTAAAFLPASNLTNPSTNLQWQGTTALDEEFITITNPDGEDLSYIGVAKHNWGSAEIPVSVERFTAVDSFTKLLLHFNGADASTTFLDSSPTPKTMTPAGNAQLDTAVKKFGSAAGLFDGTGDWVSTPDHTDFTLGSSNWTIDCWFNCTKAGGTDCDLAGHTSDGTFAGTSFFIDRGSTNVMRLFVSDGAAFTAISGTTQFTNVLNTGWHHFAAVRSGNTLMLFIDGILEASTAFSATIFNSTGSPTIGRRGDIANAPWIGSIDEFRISVGIARWTANFTPPLAEAEWSELISNVLLPDDGPALFRFPPLNYPSVRLKLRPGLAVPKAAVVYCGDLLVIQRRIFVGHTPVNYNVSTRAVNGKSESGQFLGRIVLSEATKTTLNLQNLRAPWARANMAPFFVAAREIPYFFAWRPSDYPLEVGYCWTTNDPNLLLSKQTDLMQCSIEMAGVA